MIQQHGVYGLIDATKIDQNRVYIGLCYSIDKPVQSRIIEKAMRDNDDHLNRAAHERRQASVIATNNALSEQESGYRGELEVSAEQRMNANEDKDETQFVDETLAVSTDKGKKNKRGVSCLNWPVLSCLSETRWALALTCYPTMIRALTLPGQCQWTG